MSIATESASHSARHYELEAEAARARLNDDLDQLVRRLTPGQILDEVMTSAKAHNGTLGRAVGRVAKDNPIPSVLVGAGFLLALSDRLGVSKYVAQSVNARMRPSSGFQTSRSSAGRSESAVAASADMLKSGMRDTLGAAGRSAASVGERAGEQAEHMKAGIREGASRAGDAMGDAMGDAADAVRRTAHDVRGRIGTAAEGLKDSVSGMADGATEYASSVGEGLAQAAAQSKEKGEEAARNAAWRVKQFADEQPLLVGALGLALGAVLAAVLPATRVENELMGEASDAVKNAAGETATEQLDAAKAAATRVVQEVKNVAEQEGLTPAAAVDAVRDLASKATGVVSEASESTRNEAERLVGTEKTGSAAPRVGVDPF